MTSRLACLACLACAAAPCACGPATPEPAGPAPGSAGSPAAAPPPAGTTAAAGEGWDGTADLRLGCTTVPATAPAELAAAAGLDEPGLEPAARPAALAEAARAVVRRALVRREVARLQLEPSPEEIDRAVEQVAAANFAGDREALARALDERGVAPDAYRAELAEQLGEFKAMALLAPVRPRPDDVEQEYRRRAAEAGPAALRPFDEVRDTLYSELYERRVSEWWTAHLTRLREQLETLATHDEDGACVEDWPAYTASDLQFEGNTVLTDAELRHVVQYGLGPGGTFSVLGLAAPTLLGTLVSAAYYDRGYVDLRVATELAPADQVVIRIDEGALHRLGEVQVVVRAADGTALPAELDEATWRPWLELEPGEVFVRERIGRFLERLQAAYAGRWDVPTVEVVPELATHDGVVDLRMLVTRPAPPP